MDLPSFDDLMSLYINEPARFDRLRERIIEDEIASARLKDQRRLRGIQFQIECIRTTSKTPLASCLKIQQLMHSSSRELISLLRFHSDPTYGQVERRSELYPAEQNLAHETESSRPCDGKIVYLARRSEIKDIGS
jgi:hypothetical protein